MVPALGAVPAVAAIATVLLLQVLNEVVAEGDVPARLSVDGPGGAAPAPAVEAVNVAGGDPIVDGEHCGAADAGDVVEPLAGVRGRLAAPPEERLEVEDGVRLAQVAPAVVYDLKLVRRLHVRDLRRVEHRRGVRTQDVARRRRDQVAEVAKLTFGPVSLRRNERHGRDDGRDEK